MAKIELLMPKMGESIIEATILKWVKNVGDTVEMDETILEIATDKVDSEIPSPASGTIGEIFFAEGDVVEVGKVIATLMTAGESVAPSPSVAPATPTVVQTAQTITQNIEEIQSTGQTDINPDGRFYSPLVRNIAKEENIGASELDKIPGTGVGGRVSKKDMMNYLATRSQNITTTPMVSSTPSIAPTSKPTETKTPTSISTSGNVEIVEMDRMRKLIADHMVMSKHTSPHVTSFVETDVTNMWRWREKNKKKFQDKYGENITFTPLFLDAVVRAIKDFPMVNVSLDGQKIIIKKDINIGMAAALPSGNLIVPVIKNADYLNLAGLTKSVNDLANRARTNKLKPEEIQNGTFTVTNVGTFGNVMGTPIINQPQVAILATGAIRKKPAVLETEHGDVIAIRHLMFLSLSYDHRIVDGALGGSFLKRIADYMEAFDINTNI